MKGITEKEKIEPILGASLLYYPKEEFANFLSFWEGIISEEEKEFLPSGMFYKYIGYLQQLFDHSEKEEQFSKERKINFIKLQLELESDEMTKQKFGLWFEDMLSKDDPSMFGLSDDIFYRYCWVCFKDKINLVDKKDIPFKDKLSIKPTIAKSSKEEKIFVKLSDPIEKTDLETYPMKIDFLDQCVLPMSTHFMVIAARPGNGKSTVLLRYALNLAEQKIPSLYISLEMNNAQIRSRMASAFSGKQIDKTETDLQNSILASKEFKKLDPYMDIIVGGSHDGNTILRRMEQAVEQMGTKVILLDYLSLVNFVGAKDEFESLRILTRKLKNFASEHNILVVSCAQATRASDNHGLTLSDLYGSSTIEADADIVIGIERKEAKGGFEDNVKRGKIKILKNRDGESRDFNVEIDYVRLLFSDVE